MNGEDTSSLSSEEEKEGDGAHPAAEPLLKPGWATGPKSGSLVGVATRQQQQEEDDNEEDEGSSLPTIYFSHTVEPKKVRPAQSNGSAFNPSTFLFPPPAA